MSADSGRHRRAGRRDAQVHELALGRAGRLRPHPADQPARGHVRGEHEELQLGRGRGGLGLEERLHQPGADAPALPLVRDDDAELDAVGVRRGDGMRVTDDPVVEHGHEGPVAGVGGEHHVEVDDVRRLGGGDETAVRRLRRQVPQEGPQRVAVRRAGGHDLGDGGNGGTPGTAARARLPAAPGARELAGYAVVGEGLDDGRVLG